MIIDTVVQTVVAVSRLSNPLNVSSASRLVADVRDAAHDCAITLNMQRQQLDNYREEVRVLKARLAAIAALQETPER